MTTVSFCHLKTSCQWVKAMLLAYNLCYSFCVLYGTVLFPVLHSKDRISMEVASTTIPIVSRATAVCILWYSIWISVLSALDGFSCFWPAPVKQSVLTDHHLDLVTSILSVYVRHCYAMVLGSNDGNEVQSSSFSSISSNHELLLCFISWRICRCSLLFQMIFSALCAVVLAH